jgi:hypothetical protein
MKFDLDFDTIHMYLSYVGDVANGRKRALWRDWYHRTKDTPEQQENRRKRRRAFRARIRRRLMELKTSRGCGQCAERHPACLQFHHADGRKKEFEIGRALSSKMSWARIEKEIEKCVLLCANCHLKQHPGRRPSR